MKTTFRPNTNAKKKKERVLTIALIALILAIIVFRDFSFRIANKPVFYILQPFLKIGKSINNWKEKAANSFIEKNSLSEENKVFREKITELEAKIALLADIEKENSVLKSAFSSEDLNQWREKNKQKFILASIISRPPLVPFDTLIIDSGSLNGIKEGMQVSAFGNILLGYAEDVFSNTSKIKLVSSFGEETNIVLESSQTPAIAVGRGGENFEIILPKAVSVVVGERIMTLGKQPMFVGLIEKIEHQSTDPFQKIIFRLPVNLQHLRQVFILRKI